MPLNTLTTDPASLTAKKLCAEFQVEVAKGLTHDEVLARREHFGLNQLPTDPPVPFWKLVLGQFDDVLVRILLMAAVVSFVMATFEQGFSNFVEPFIILLILTLNAIVGVWQERRAGDAISSLKHFVPATAVVVRDGKKRTVHAEELVPGDIVEVAVGDRVPADVRVLEIQSTTLRVDQSILTGESEEVIKHVEEVQVHDERFANNMIFSGTAIVHGKACGLVVKTGSSTEIGLIERDVREQEDVKTPLQIKLDEFGILLSKVIGYICLAVFVVNMFHWFYTHDSSKNEVWYERYVQPTVHCLKVAVSLAVAAIPEGLPAVVTTCLALGTRRMARCNAFVRDLPSVETLGRCTVICSDKTGTLTTNCMSVVEVTTVGAHSGELITYNIEDSKYEIISNSVTCDGVQAKNPLAHNAALDMLSTVAVLCNESSLYRIPDGSIGKVGESTEAALLVMCEKLARTPAANPTHNLPLNEFLLSKQNLWGKEATLEFTHTRKSMSVCCVSKLNHKINNLFVKGAPEEILRRSSRVMLANGKIVPLDSITLNSFVNQTKLMSSSGKALRCIGFAFSPCPPAKELELSNPHTFETIESGLIFLGVCGMLDPPREEVHDAISKCRSAGIRVIVITGDKKETAEAVCQKIGLLNGENTSLLSYTGLEFDKMSLTQKKNAIQNAVVFSRTDPSHKMQLIKLLQEQRLICAMTGDGVNDSPALKCADIGIAMGSGTEVAKDTSQLILADDNFATIVKAVQEGRAIFNNTKQFIRYLISSNIGEVVCVLATGILGFPEALSPIQLLWVNLVTDGLPATALGFNAPDPDIMAQPPRDVDEPIVNGWLFLRYMIIGVYVGLATVAGFLWWFFHNCFTWSDLTSFTSCTDMTSTKCVVLANPEAARSIALSILVVIEMLNALNAISENHSLMVCRPTSNIWLLFAIASSIALHLMIMYVPFFARLFCIAPLGVDPTYARSAHPWSILVPTSFMEWKVVLVFSIPVIFIDEILKFVSRRVMQAKSKISSKKKN